MIHALTLVVYAVAASTALPRVLRGREWTERAPRPAIALWMAACASVIASAVLAPLVAAIPPSVIGHDLASLFDACAYLLVPHRGDLDGLAAKTKLAMLVVILILARLAYCTAAVLNRARRERRRHAEMLSLLGHHDGELGAMVVEHGAVCSVRSARDLAIGLANPVGWAVERRRTQCPSIFRAYAPKAVAESDALWRNVPAGDVAVSFALGT
jgi:hypothetical protein